MFPRHRISTPGPSAPNGPIARPYSCAVFSLTTHASASLAPCHPKLTLGPQSFAGPPPDRRHQHAQRITPPIPTSTVATAKPHQPQRLLLTAASYPCSSPQGLLVPSTLPRRARHGTGPLGAAIVLLPTPRSSGPIWYRPSGYRHIAYLRTRHPTTNCRHQGAITNARQSSNATGTLFSSTSASGSDIPLCIRFFIITLYLIEFFPAN